MTGAYLLGLLRRRPAQLLLAAASLAVTVSFVASLGAFASQSRADLTTRAAASVPVDWQVQVTPQGNPADVMSAVRKLPDVRAVEPVALARVTALESTGPGGTRTTGAAYVVALPTGYADAFPAELRPLLGNVHGVLVLQQTAANLAAIPGSRVDVRTAGGDRFVTVDGVVDMPAADSFFQVVGLAPGAGASAPPDNVVLVPPDQFASVVGSAPVVHQIHIAFRHERLPHDPQQAATNVVGRANHLQAAVAGGALVGDNLGTALAGAREDARYADLLFLLLGVPGLALAVVVAGLVVSLRSHRRRREVALLRLRGASTGALLRAVVAEATATAVVAAAVGIPVAALAVHLAVSASTPLSVGWCVAAAVGGWLLALATQVAPVLRLATGRADAVSAEAIPSPGTRLPWPLRAGLDVVLLAAAGVAFALTARSGYQVVLAPEGVLTTQVNYAALAGPALAWPGLALLVWRVTAWSVGRRTGRWARKVPGRAPELEAAALRQRRRVVARGAAGLAVALGLAISTAVFTATYRTQSHLDVALTVGSDVAVTMPAGGHAGADTSAAIAAAPGVRAVEPLQHRFAYVGPDLQDVYGIRAATIGRAAPLQDAFVPGGNVRATVAGLQRTPDGVLLSGETLHDYQLHPGDQVRLRLQTGADRAYRPVTFHVVGQVNEWPTAPKDSFIVANAAYLSQVTGSSDIATFLVSSSTPTATAADLRSRLTGTGATVQDINSARAQVSTASGLAATDLAGLSRLELGYGVLLALACSALALLVGIVERRRALVLLAVLGANARQRGRFLTSEAVSLVVSGVLGGAAIGAVVAYLLVKVLTGIFDPPPTAATIPAGYLIWLVGVVVSATILVVAGAGRLVARAGPSELRDL